MKSSKPILMSGEMVRATLRDVNPKTQTRRIIKCRGWVDSDGDGWPLIQTIEPQLIRARCPYGQPGTRLWVKETFGKIPNDGGTYVYRATDPDWDSTEDWKWKPSIFMPRIASRITLEIVSIRVERVQEISEEDAKAEGVRDNSEPAWPHDIRLCPQCGGTGLHESAGPNLGVIEVDCANCDTYAKRFRILWESINGPESWNENPWVWVVEFRRITKPILMGER